MLQRYEKNIWQTERLERRFTSRRSLTHRRRASSSSPAWVKPAPLFNTFTATRRPSLPTQTPDQMCMLVTGQSKRQTKYLFDPIFNYYNYMMPNKIKFLHRFHPDHITQSQNEPTWGPGRAIQWRNNPSRVWTPPGIFCWRCPLSGWGGTHLGGIKAEWHEWTKSHF